MIGTWAQLKASIERVERETRDMPNDGHALVLTRGEVTMLARAERWSEPPSRPDPSRGRTAMSDRPFPEAESPPDGSPCDYGNLYSERARRQRLVDQTLEEKEEYRQTWIEEHGGADSGVDMPAGELADLLKDEIAAAQAEVDEVNAHIAAIDARCARWTAGERDEVDVAAELERIRKNYMGICIRSRLDATPGETAEGAETACGAMWETDRPAYEARIRNPGQPPEPVTNDENGA